jgi:hypothetical protein
MARKLLTINQTNFIKAIRAELHARLGKEVTITDIFNAILNNSMLTSISLRIKFAHEQKEKIDTIKKNRKEYNVYQGEVLSNGILYRAIIAARNKQQIQSLLVIDEREAIKWTKSVCPSHYDIALTAPGTFFGSLSTQRGRPSSSHYNKLTNVKPIKGIPI